jgi:hypothetical protein
MQFCHIDHIVLEDEVPISGYKLYAEDFMSMPQSTSAFLPMNEIKDYMKIVGFSLDIWN